MIRRANELVLPGEKAIVLFTRGPLFKYDGNGNGQTGNWVVGEKSLSEIDKVIIYERHELTGTTTVFMANYLDWVDSPEQGRKVLRFSGLENKGITQSNWFGFGGKGWSPTFYIR